MNINLSCIQLAVKVEFHEKVNDFLVFEAQIPFHFRINNYMEINTNLLQFDVNCLIKPMT